MAVIEVRDLSKRFYSKTNSLDSDVLSGINFTVDNGQFVSLLGRSGCGKSTLLKLIGGLDTQYQGSVYVDGQVFAKLGRDGPRLGYVFQQPRLLPWKTVKQNLVFVLKRSEIKDVTECAENWLERVGLKDCLNAYPHELSGGMQQRVAIARAFALEPDVLLMDEPFSGLDEFTSRSMRHELLELWQQTHKTVIFVTHNCFEACYLSDRVLVLGGKPSGVVENRELQLARPRDYESSDLFQMSVEMTHTVIESAANSI